MAHHLTVRAFSGAPFNGARYSVTEENLGPGALQHGRQGVHGAREGRDLHGQGAAQRSGGRVGVSDIVFKSVLLTLCSVKKCLIDSM